MFRRGGGSYIGILLCYHGEGYHGEVAFMMGRYAAIIEVTHSLMCIQSYLHWQTHALHDL